MFTAAVCYSTEGKRVGYIPPRSWIFLAWRRDQTVNSVDNVITGYNRPAYYSWSVCTSAQFDGLANDDSSSLKAVDHLATANMAEGKRKIVASSALQSELIRVLGICRDGTIADCKIVKGFEPHQLEIQRRNLLAINT